MCFADNSTAYVCRPRCSRCREYKDPDIDFGPRETRAAQWRFRSRCAYLHVRIWHVVNLHARTLVQSTIEEQCSCLLLLIALPRSGIVKPEHHSIYAVSPPCAGTAVYRSSPWYHDSGERLRCCSRWSTRPLDVFSSVVPCVVRNVHLSMSFGSTGSRWCSSSFGR